MEPDPVDALFSDMQYIWDSLEHIFRKQMALRTRGVRLWTCPDVQCVGSMWLISLCQSLGTYIFTCFCTYVLDFWPTVHISLLIKYLNWSTAVKMTFLSWLRVYWLDSLSVRYFGPACQVSSFLSFGFPQCTWLQYFSWVAIFVSLPFSEQNHALS